jgi:S1-C subfamily serine protease
VTADASSNATTATTSVATLAATAERSIVRITSRITVQGSFIQASQTGELVGTGFVIGSDGLILTNAHVVEHAQSITVTMANGRTYQATVVRSDQAGDLAELKIDATGLPALRLDTSSAVVGESVVAIGYALGLEGDPTVTTGIISSTDRTIQVQDDVAGVVRTYAHILQISAPINPGNSGGPVLDAGGEVIAIATAGASGAQDVGFAIPIMQATSLIAGA